MGLAQPLPANELFSHVQITRKQVVPCLGNLGDFIKRYQPGFYRSEQRDHARTYIEGLLSDLPRKSIEPIATDHGQERRPLQRFVGTGAWSDQKVRREFLAHVVEELGDPQGVIVIDPSAFPKKGADSVGVKRQWCGRLGKQDNCQVGVYLGYAGRGSSTLIDTDLYLPREWCRSRARRRNCHVPEHVRFRTSAKISLDLLKAVSAHLPHAWVVGDDEFGRPAWFRRALDRAGERYILDVPSNTRIRDLDAPAAQRHRRQAGRPAAAPFLQAVEWARLQPASAWKRLTVRDGEKGPIEVEAILASVQTYFERRIGPTETLLITRTLTSKPEYRFCLSNAPKDVSLERLVEVASRRHTVEECFERAKGEAGLAHYEVRSWLGWHHHMTLSMLATWFLTLEARRVGGENTGRLGAADGSSVPDAAA
jgi:SRSO17 transposase